MILNHLKSYRLFGNYYYIHMGLYLHLMPLVPKLQHLEASARSKRAQMPSSKKLLATPLRLSLSCLSSHEGQGVTQDVILGRVVAADLVSGGQEVSLVDLLVLSTLDVDVLSFPGGVAHQQGGGAGHGVAALDLDVDGGHGLLQAGEDRGVGPGGCDGVDADGELHLHEDGVETTGEAGDGVLGRGCITFVSRNWLRDRRGDLAYCSRLRDISGYPWWIRRRRCCRPRPAGADSTDPESLCS